ncbi:MAG: ASCH domain-containing protein [Bacteroidota bacterium]|nr:ASCH domain-containing protein [Bacteroidota bacterium]
MKSYHSSVSEMWNRFTDSNPEFKQKKYTAWYFCDNEKCANELAELVKRGIKRGTATLLYWIEKGKETLAQKRDYSVVTDWDGIAQCIIQTKNITLLPFNEITKELAFIEGEGDKSLDYWKQAHRNYFTRNLINESIDFKDDMIVVFEEFELIYPKF